jgi:transcriptional regulator with XRE-family HTH domain
MWALNIADRLRALRRARKLGQDHVAKHLGMSVSEVSRLERGLRSLRIDQIAPWTASLGLQSEIVLWSPTNPDGSGGLSAEDLRVLEEVARTLPHLPTQAREALLAQMKAWHSP